MKQILLYLVVIMGMFCSCVDLDREIVTTLSKEQINKEYELTRNQVTSLYSDLTQGYFLLGNAMEASACDEAAYTYLGSIQLINSGGWGPLNNPDDVLKKYYTAIRKVNDFLNPLAEINLDAYKFDKAESSQAIYSQRSAEIKNWKYEARFLRAFFFFELVKRYGGLPILKETLPLNADFSSIKRNTLNECIRFIVDECDSVCVEGALPEKYNDENLGRVTKGAAKALKSRILLYKASDLYNSLDRWAPGYAHAELVSVTGDRKKMWEDAAQAALDVIRLSAAGYSLATDYTVFGKTFNNPELILVHRTWEWNDFERLNFPIGAAVGQGNVVPSQNLVDAYEMIDGSQFDWNNPVHAANPYKDRDPRLDFTVYRNESRFKGAGLECFKGGVNGPGVPNATKTGYYLRKFVDSELDLVQNRRSIHSWVLLRLGEIYLNYAEALNESDPGNPDILLYLNNVRQRRGVNMPKITDTDQAIVREKIRNERRIELAFEGHRLWDTRRWMIAPQTLGSPLRGVEITKDNQQFSYRQVEVEKRVFEPKMYFYPIPQSILLMEGNNWDQNPLW